MAAVDYAIEFHWKESVIYWEGSRGVVFPGGWGVNPLVTYVPDAATWARRAPDWLRDRRDVVVARLRSHPGHVVREEGDESIEVRPLEEVAR